MRADFSRLPHVTNDLFYPAFWDEHRFLGLRGGRGSGKSVFAADKIIKRVIQEPGHKIGAFRKVRRTIPQSMLYEYQKAIAKFGASDYFTLNKNDLILKFAPNGNEIHFLGLDDREKIKSFAGMTSAHIEEATELTRDDFVAVNMILRGQTAHYKQIICSYNPINVYHWLKTSFEDKVGDGRHALIASTYKDNRFIDAEYGEELELLKELDPELYKIFTLGEWGALKNLIYQNWETKAFDPDLQTGELIYGLDFGYTNPTALVQCNFRERDVFVTEKLYQTRLTDDDLIDTLKQIIPENLRSAPIYADSANPAAIESVRRAGFNCIPADKDVVAGIKSVKQYRLLVNVGSQNLVNELQTYKWKEDREGRVIEEPVKYNDHALDALRYAIYSRLMLICNLVTGKDVKTRRGDYVTDAELNGIF